MPAIEFNDESYDRSKLPPVPSPVRLRKDFFPRSSKRVRDRNMRGCSDMHWFACMSNVHIDYSFKQIRNSRFWLNKVFRADGFCSKVTHFTHACMFSHPISKRSTIRISQRLEFYIVLPLEGGNQHNAIM